MDRMMRARRAALRRLERRPIKCPAPARAKVGWRIRRAGLRAGRSLLRPDYSGRASRSASPSNSAGVSLLCNSLCTFSSSRACCSAISATRELLMSHGLW